MEVPLARAPPGSPRSPLRVPPGSPSSLLRLPPGSPKSDLPPLTRLPPPPPPPPASPNSRPKLFFLLSKVPHWLFAISCCFHYYNKPGISLFLLLPPHLLIFINLLLFEEMCIFHLNSSHLYHCFYFCSLFSIFLFSFAIFSPFIPLSLPSLCFTH